MKSRFRDTGKTIYEFGHEFLVRCPRCDKCARVVPRNLEDARYFAPRRLICQECGYTQDWDRKSNVGRDICDDYFGLPLWLQTPCCSRTLWAYNKEHLDFLENYVKAGLRESFPQEVHEIGRVIWRNKSLA